MKKQDVKSFQTAGSQVNTTVREVFKAQWGQSLPNIFEFTIEGDGFLKQMVRNIVGTQLHLVKKGLPAHLFQEIIEQRDRSAAFESAPPQGLALYSIQYPEELDNKCLKL